MEIRIPAGVGYGKVGIKQRQSLPDASDWRLKPRDKGGGLKKNTRSGQALLQLPNRKI
jgi:hypothetical protein